MAPLWGNMAVDIVAIESNIKANGQIYTKNVTTQPIFILNALVLLYNLEIEHNLK
jgi:hypothetical protein